MLTLINVPPFCRLYRICLRTSGIGRGIGKRPGYPESGIERFLIMDGDFPVSLLFPEILGPPVLEITV